jgi:hypothetical protein
MEKEHDYTRDIAAIRSMMERSSKFLSLSGWAGIMAGIYALVGAYMAYAFFRFNPDELQYVPAENPTHTLLPVILLATAVLILSIATAILLSYKRAKKREESMWNPTSQRMITAMALPLVSGGVLILVLLASGLTGLLAPLTLLFYGLALFSAGNYTFKEIQYLGIIQVGLGLVSSYYIELSLLLWAVGFGLMHIVYGIYIHIRHER